MMKGNSRMCILEIMRTTTDGLYRQDSNLLSALASMYDERKDHFVIGNPKMDINCLLFFKDLTVRAY